jgi:hypothetical protein
VLDHLHRSKGRNRSVSGWKAVLATVRTKADRPFADQILGPLDSDLEHDKPPQTLERLSACGSAPQGDEGQDDLQGASHAPVVRDCHQNRQKKNDSDHGIGPFGNSSMRCIAVLDGRFSGVRSKSSVGHLCKILARSNDRLDWCCL